MFGNVNEVLIKLRAVLEGKGFEDVQKETKKTQDSTKKLQDAFKGLLPALGVAAIVAAMKKMSDSAMQYALAIDSVNDITGAGSVQSSKWVAQAQYVGVSAQAVANGMAILGKNMVANQTIFERHGVAIKDNNGQLLSLEQVLGNVRDRAREMGNGAQKTALEMELMGRSGKELDDFLMATNEEMEGVARQAEKLGLVLDDVTLNSIEAQKREMNKLAMVGQSLGMELNKTLNPAINVLGSVALWAAQQFGKLVSISENHGRVLGRVFGNANQVRKETELYTKLLATGKITQEQYNDAMAAMGSQVKDNIVGIKDLGKTTTATTNSNISNAKRQTTTEDTENKERVKSHEKAEEEKTKATKKAEEEKAKAAKEAADAIEKENDRIKKNTDDTAKLMAQSFRAAATNTKNAWDTLATNITDTLVTKAFTPMAEGLNSMLGQFGDIGTVMTGGVGGAIGVLVGGFVSMFSYNVKSVTEYTKEAYDAMVDKTNSKLEDIGRIKTEAERKLGLLEKIKPAEGGTIAQSELADFLGVTGMTYEAARSGFLAELQEGAKGEVAIREQAIDDARREIEDAKRREQELRNSAGDYWLHQDVYWNELNAALGRQAAAQQLIDKYNKEMFEAQASAYEMGLRTGLPALASGGIVTKPTVALIGEAGPEAVVPLSGSGGGVAGININMTNTFSGVNWTDEAQKDAIARELAARVQSYVSGGKRLPYGTMRRY